MHYLLISSASATSSALAVYLQNIKISEKKFHLEISPWNLIAVFWRYLTLIWRYARNIYIKMISLNSSTKNMPAIFFEKFSRFSKIMPFRIHLDWKPSVNLSTVIRKLFFSNFPGISRFWDVANKNKLQKLAWISLLEFWEDLVKNSEIDFGQIWSLFAL